MAETITLGGRSFELPRPTIPYLVELGQILDDEKPGVAGIAERNGRIVGAALKRTGAEFDPDTVEVGFDELNAAIEKIMQVAGFQWGKAPPANAGYQSSSTSSSPPSQPAADTSGPETSPS